MQSFKVYAPAKLNLYLDVLDKRPDGFHNIETLFEKIDLKDEIKIKEKKTGIEVKVEPKTLCPGGKDNIVYKAVARLLKESGKDLGIEVTIKKRIPVGSGLGGGSSDAASVLRAINEKFNLGIDNERLFSIASELGKDIPFFMRDEAFLIGKGRGEDLESIEIDSSFSHVVVKPSVSTSTERMYKRLDDSKRTKRQDNLKALTEATKKIDLVSLKKSYYNDFEEVLSNNTQYEQAKSLLLEAGAEAVFLSGSGSALFCTFKDKRKAEEILEAIPKRKDMDVFLATTYKGGIYGNN